MVKAASLPMAVLTDIPNRGVTDVFFLLFYGLKGRLEVFSNVWPMTTVQARIIHLIIGSFRLASPKYWDDLTHDIRPI